MVEPSESTSALLALTNSHIISVCASMLLRPIRRLCRAQHRARRFSSCGVARPIATRTKSSMFFRGIAEGWALSFIRAMPSLGPVGTHISKPVHRANC
jgi:hypothetical protein